MYLGLFSESWSSLFLDDIREHIWLFATENYRELEYKYFLTFLLGYKTEILLGASEKSSLEK